MRCLLSLLIACIVIITSPEIIIADVNKNTDASVNVLPDGDVSGSPAMQCAEIYLTQYMLFPQGSAELGAIQTRIKEMIFATKKKMTTDEFSTALKKIKTPAKNTVLSLKTEKQKSEFYKKIVSCDGQYAYKTIYLPKPKNYKTDEEALKSLASDSKKGLGFFPDIKKCAVRYGALFFYYNKDDESYKEMSNRFINTIFMKYEGKFDRERFNKLLETFKKPIQDYYKSAKLPDVIQESRTCNRLFKYKEIPFSPKIKQALGNN